MAWPLSQDYNEALQNPLTSFSDAELRQGQVVTNALGIPQPCSGNFADVYAVECAASKSKWAVKCFTRQVSGLSERYSEISKYLRLAKLPFTVEFQYLEQGVRVRGQWYPILKMHWVEGFVLNAFVRDNLDKKPILQALGQIWLRMARRLRESYIAHCDLQHGNVMFVPGSSAHSLAVKLIDYDGMCVPSLIGTKSGEVGHPAYQHPERLRTGAYNQEVDRFSLLSIAAALRCLAVGGRSLWQRYDNGDNLLFRQSDLQAPADSPLFRELRTIDDAQARMLVQELYRACQGPLDDVPLLTDLLPEEKAASKATATVAKQPAAAKGSNWDFPERETGKSVAAKKQAATSKRPGWIWGALAGAAALLLLGGVLIWAMSSKSPPPKSPNTPDPQQARVKPKDNKSPRPIERNKQDDPPTPPVKPKSDDVPPPVKPKPDETPAKPAEGALPLPYGPLDKVRDFVGHDADVTSVAFSPDGKRALSGSSDNTVRLWDVASDKQIHCLKGHSQMVWSVAFSPDGKQAVSASYDTTARVWDLDKGEEALIFRAHAPHAVRRAVFSPDGKQAFSAGWDRVVRQWNVENALETQHYDGNKTNIYWMALSPDGKRVLSTGGDRDIHCWDTANGKELEPYKGNTGDVYTIEFSRDGQFVAASGGDRVIRIWRAAEPAAPLHKLSGHTGQVNALSFTPDGRRLLSASADGTIRLWDVASGKELGRYHGVEGMQMFSVAVSPDGRGFLSGGSQKLVRLWRLPPADVLAGKPDDPVGEVRSFKGHTAELNSVAFSPDRRHALSASSDGTVRLWDLTTGKEVKQFAGHQGSVQSVAFSPDGRLALTGGLDKTARVWDVEKGEERLSYRGQNDWVRSVAFSPDGKRALTASGGPGNIDCTVRLWHVANGEIIQTLRGHDKPVTSAVFTPDGRRAVSGSDDTTVRLWDLGDGHEVRKYAGQKSFVYGVAVSGDGRIAASAGFDSTVRLWDLESDKELLRLSGHTGLVMSVSISPEGRRVLSGSLDKTMRLWDMANGRELKRFEEKENPDAVRCVAFSPDGRYVLSGGADKVMRLWRLPFAPFVVGRPLEIKAAPPPPPITGKFPLPDEPALKKWTEEIREQKYRTEYASKDSGELAKLADKLLEHGLKKSEQPDGRYVYLVEASDVAAKAGDSVLSLRALDELSKLFNIKEELSMKAAALQTAAKAAKTLSSGKATLESALALFAEAIQADDYDSAEQLTKAAEAVARHAGASPKVIQPLANEVKRLKTKYADIKTAVARLSQDAKDAEANRIVGSFRCFEKADWKRGLPLLALGDDAKLKTLAEKDRDAGPASDARAAVGDGWWTLAQSRAKGPPRANIQQRACDWYGMALPDALKKSGDRMERNIRRHHTDYPASAWGHLDITQGKVIPGSLLVPKDDKEISTRESHSGPIEITVLARTSKNDIRFRWAKGSCVIFNWADKTTELRVTRPDGNDRSESGSLATAPVKPLQPNSWYLLSWRITEEGMSVSENGRVVFSEEHKNDLSAKHPVRVNTFDSDIEVLSFTVRPIGKSP